MGKIQTKHFEERTLEKRRGWRIEPRTAIALIVGFAVVYSQVTRPSDMNAGRIVYEADTNGQMQRVATPSVSKQALPPLWKPEVHLLVEHQGELNLTAEQWKILQQLDVEWTREKTHWQRQLGLATTETDTLLKHTTPERSASLSMVSNNLKDYSRLSQEYNQRRAAYWGQASGLLTNSQRGQLDSLRLLEKGQRRP